MKALSLEKGGTLEGFRIIEKSIPQIKDDELLVKVHAVGLNPSDYQTAEYYPENISGIVLGLDVSGVVEAVGPCVKNFKIGDRVFFLRQINNPNGGFAEFATTPAILATKIPENINYIDAATLPGAGFTAYHILFERFNVKSGKTIFIQGGAGGLGSYAIQLSKHLGLKVITTCLGRDIEYVKKLGADIAIDYMNEDVYGILKRETDNFGPHYIISSIGPQGATRDLEALRFGGELAVTAGLPDFSTWEFYKKGISVHEVAFGEYLTSSNKEDNIRVATIGEKLSELLAQSHISKPHVTLTSLENIPEWLGKIKRGEVFGKVVALTS